MEKVLIVLLALVLASAVAGAGLAANSAAKGQAQATYPVSGGKINQSIYAK